MTNLLLNFLALALCCQLAVAQPYRPQQDDELLETLPIQGPQRLAIRALQAEVQAAPQAFAPARALVERYIELGRAESDPRYYGYAEAVLASWLQSPRPPAEAYALRATLRQNRHDFAAALADLQMALQRQPRLAQAWLVQAAILEVQGRYAEAQASCLPLLQTASALVAAVCNQSVRSMSGALDDSYRRLLLALSGADREADADRQWAWTTLAEMAERRGDPVAADSHYRQALHIGRRNGYLLATYADFLLDRQRYVEVVSLLRNETRADGLLLRLTLAEQALQVPDADAHNTALQQRFAAGRQRGDISHRGDEARFRLQLLNQPQQALQLALDNWAVQREPRDARIVLEAALAAGNSRGALPTVQFLRQNSVQDARLQPLLERYAGGMS